MRIEASRWIAVRFAYAETESRLDGWGRLSRLSAAGGDLLTRFKAEKGERLFLSFELYGENFDAAACDVVSSGADRDGYVRAQIRFREEAFRAALGRALRGIVSHAEGRPSRTSPDG